MNEKKKAELREDNEINENSAIEGAIKELE
jgi:hypothetical protein